MRSDSLQGKSATALVASRTLLVAILLLPRAMRAKQRPILSSISTSKRSPKSSRLPLPATSLSSRVAYLTRQRRHRQALGVLLLLLLFIGSYHESGYLRNGKLELFFSWLGYMLRSSLPDGGSRAYSRSINRNAARIPRLIMSLSLAGIDPQYAARELPTDMRDHGANNYTVEPKSGLSPSSAFKNLVFAKPSTEVLATLPQYRGHNCLSPYPLSVCPFPGLCAPPEHPEKSSQPCAVWGTGKPSSVTRYLAGSTHGETANFRTGKQLRDWDAPGRWVRDLYHLYGHNGRTRAQAGGDRDLHFFTPEQMHSCLRGKRIVVQGDSILRQFFGRVMAYSRLQPTSCEHLANWNTASYAVFENGTDAYEPSCPDRRCHFAGRRTCPSDGDEGRYCCPGTVYWIGPDVDLAHERGNITRMFAEPAWHDAAFSWFLSPEKTADWYSQYDWRNGRMRKFVKESRSSGARANVLPVDRLARVNNGRRIVRDRRPITSEQDDVHFKCGFLKADWPNTLKPGLQNLKAPTDWDARDVFNLNILQLWLNGICDPA
ncbi:hypothetical protein BKA62DRAFT_699866 [Auriculariales sp. MPI-PUGE-AT-0066]|nr:hypothetical protein BKA62DRAFT_699866 [Auriculariales sp. MPI-PUGE-AT-0066]